MDRARGDTFGTRLRRLREAAALTQEELAARAGLSAKSIGALERGERRRPHPPTIRALAAALGLSEAGQIALAGIEPGAEIVATGAQGPGAPPGTSTPLFGRDDDLSALGTLLGASRLLTLTGPGGVGKTRLALALAARSGDCYPDGITVVALAPLADPALVLPAIAHALGVWEGGDAPLRATLHAALRPRRALLVLDNLEHLLAAAADEAGALLAACPHLTILATSRAPLRLAGEQEWAVAPLATPALDRVPTAAEVAAAPAAQLFVARARAVAPGFALTDANAAAVAAICRRLDGLPLALELAAAWAKLLPPTALLARLDPALPLLEGGARDLPARQRTLRATIAWSHDLLDERERTLLRRLAVFAGGCSLETAEAVCADDALPVSMILTAAAALLDQSLIRRAPDAGSVAGGALTPDEEAEPRVALLETIREYAAERLDESGEGPIVRARHAAHFLALAEASAARLHGAAQGRWLDRFEREHDNLRAALDWLAARGEIERGLRLANALHQFWWVRGHLREGRSRLGALLAQTKPVADIVRARALRGAGRIAQHLGDYDESRALLAEGRALAEAAGDRGGVAAALEHLGWAVAGRGDYDGASRHFAEALGHARGAGEDRPLAAALLGLGTMAQQRGDAAAARPYYAEGLARCRALGDTNGIARALHGLGTIAALEGDHAAAQAHYRESLALLRHLGDRVGAGRSLHNQGALAHDLGDHRAARRLLAEGQAIFAEVGDRRHFADGLYQLGRVAQALGDHEGAHAAYREGLTLAAALGHRRGIAQALEGLATLAAARGQAVRAARLAGAVSHLREATGTRRWPDADAGYERHLAAVRRHLDEATWRAAYAEGSALPVDTAIAEALEESTPPANGDGASRAG